jgi:predicted dehydrogenase
VYIATTHQNHLSLACEALEAGMPDLVEKPVGLHADEVAHMFQLAQKNEFFVIEAMWTRFLPATLKLLEH